MESLLATHARLLKEINDFGGLYLRPAYRDFSFDGRIVGLVGPRGVGKTTFLLKYILDHFGDSDRALYLSADHLYFAENSLLSVAETFYQESAGELLCIDEVHRYPDWNRELKNIYDSLPKLKIIFSGSSSLDLVKGKFDLSRRALLHRLPGFSFREFLEASTGVELPALTLPEILEQPGAASKRFASIPKLMGYFKDYLRAGYYPHHLEFQEHRNFLQTLVAIIDKSIYRDIASFYSVSTENLGVMQKIIYFFSTSEPGEINVNKLANSLQRDHKTVSRYIEILQESGLLRFLLKDKRGHALVRNAPKVYLDNSNLIHAVNQEVGKEVGMGLVRETFFVNQMENAGHQVWYSDQADFYAEGRHLEIGGAGKSKKKSKTGPSMLLVRDDVLVGSPGVIPLYLFGLL